MENEMEIINKDVPAREIKAITAEIWELRHQAQCMALHYAVEIGRRLDEAKRALKHGEWGDWLQNEVEFSKSSAYNFMKLYYEYGSCEALLSGDESKFQSIGNLPYSKALLLLAVPSEEREEFAEQVHADSLSASELKRAIADRKRSFYAPDEDRCADMGGCRLSEAEPQVTLPSKSEIGTNLQSYNEIPQEAGNGELSYEERRREAERFSMEIEEDDSLSPSMHAYMRLTCLIPEFHPLVDEKKIGKTIGVLLSYLNWDDQKTVFNSMTEHDVLPSGEQVRNLLKACAKGKLTKEKADEILTNGLSAGKEGAYVKLIPYLPKGLNDKDADDYIIKALKAYGNR